MKQINDLTKPQLVDFVSSLWERFYRDDQQQLDPDNQVNGSDLVDLVAQLFSQLDIVPPPLEDDDYVSFTECVESGQHLESCDDDGFCNSCDEQDSCI